MSADGTVRISSVRLSFCCGEIIDGHLTQTLEVQIFPPVTLIEWRFHLTPRKRGAIAIVLLLKYGSSLMKELFFFFFSSNQWQKDKTLSGLQGSSEHSDPDPAQIQSGLSQVMYKEMPH